MKKNLKILYLIFFITVALSNKVSINVIDSTLYSPLYNANVSIVDSSGAEYGGSTDFDGSYMINDLSYGTYNLLITFIGYKKFKTEILFDGNELTVVCPMTIAPILVPELNIISDANTYRSLAGAGTVMTEGSIKKISPIGTQEILEHVPGVTAFADDGIGNSRISVGIRGLNPRRSSRVLILEDGIPIQPALYVYPNMYYNPPVERIDEVEVIKGSGTIKYGPQTMGGVINYSTRRPSIEPEGFTNLTIGNNGYRSLFAEANGFGSKRIKNAFQFLYKAGDGFRENNGFLQFNGTFKSIYNKSNDRSLYSKISMNYENSNATYTGLTEYSFENDPNFNPKEDDNFKVFRASFDLIDTYQMSRNVKRERKLFISYFNRRWWRENDVFSCLSDPTLEEVALSPSGTVQYCDDIIRVGNGTDNFGILRTFYVGGIEQTYSFKGDIFGLKSTSELGSRLYWEKFIDNKQTGDSPDARDGIFFYDAETYSDENDNYTYDLGENFDDLNGNNLFDENETVVGQSHHYETTAVSGFISNSLKVNSFTTINSGIRVELFEQGRIDLLDGASYLDKTSFELLPSIGFIAEFPLFNIFGGIHRGYTAPSSGALKSTTFSLDTGLDLKSEKSWNKEIGFRSTNPSSESNIELSLFHVNIDDMVAAGRGGQFGVFQNDSSSVVTMGSELSMLLQTKSRFLPALHVSHTFMVGKIDDAVLPQYTFISSAGPINISGNRLPYVPMNTLLVGLEQSFGSMLTIRFDYKYVDKVYTDFHNIDTDDYYVGFGSTVGFGSLGIDGVVPSYSIYNLTGLFEPTSRIKINLSVKNLFDKIYIGSLLHSNPGQRQANMSSGIIPGPRRQISLSIKYKIK